MLEFGRQPGYQCELKSFVGTGQRYIASYRQVSAEGTGASEFSPLGAGLLTLKDMPGMLAGVKAIEKVCGRRSRAATPLWKSSATRGVLSRQ
jgi:hypothetical protein